MDTVFVVTEKSVGIDWVGISAIIIAIIALAISIWQGRETRIHNRKSVLPIPQVIVGDYENLVIIKLQNAGTGPVRINKINVSNEDNEFPSVVKAVPQPPNGFLWEDFTTAQKFSLLPGGEKILLSFRFIDKQSDDIRIYINELREALSKLSIYLEYEDIYDNMLTLNHSLTWFGRKKIDNSKKRN